MFLTSRRFIYQQVYFHRTVRAIDLDLAEVFAPSIRAIFGDGSPADRLADYADLDEYGLLHQAARWARGEALAARPAPGDGTVTGDVAEAWRAILLRRPTWRSEAEVRAEYEPGGRPEALVASLGVAGGRTRRDRPCRGRRPPGRRGRDRQPAGDRDARRRADVARRRARLDPGLLAHRPTVSAALRQAGRPGSPRYDAGLGAAFGDLAGLGGRTSSGSTRAISIVGTFIRFTTEASIANLPGSSVLNSP